MVCENIVAAARLLALRQKPHEADKSTIFGCHSCCSQLLHTTNGYTGRGNHLRIGELAASRFSTHITI